MNIDPSTTKYLVKAKLNADGIVEKPDVVGAIFGQTEGLLGDELDLRDLQKSGRIGRIEVDVHSRQGKSEGQILIPSSLDQVETVILASALETIDRVGPCKAKITVESIEDVRVVKREKIIERARELLTELIKQSKTSGIDLTESVRQSVQVEEITYYGKDRLPAGPNVAESDAIIVVEGRSDVLNLLKSGIKNAIAVEGTNVPKTIMDLSKERVITAFVDGDRGGELILREMFQVAEVDFVARAPRAHEVEELTQKQIMKCLRNKIPGDQFIEMFNLDLGDAKDKEKRLEPNNVKVEKLERFEKAERADRDKEKDDEPVRTEREPRAEKPERREREEPRQEKEPRPEPRPERQERREREPRAERQDRREREEPRQEKEPKAEQRQEREPRADRQERPPVEEKELEERKPVSRKQLSGAQEKFKGMINELSSTSKARILDAMGGIKKEVAVKELVNTLKEEKDPVFAVVFDGIITQRILDLASDLKIGTIVGTKMGNITKQPAGTDVWSKDDLN
ncbi:MAG TPA: DNA primase DnaG [Methanomassiliicoccales archaeon]|nr:DNA primase [Methanomassiliicoccales archaeon]HNX47145.1 DNA primase DnaG [Methanomassiliicoccales archaeon]HPR98808.1 DNA primase DnaG [Methanomassiliicoccales archaeon]